MATISAPRSWAAFTRRALGVSAVASVALVALAVPASAHTKAVSAKCDGEQTVLTVELKKYNPHKKNTVTIFDGDDDIVPTKNFKAEFSFAKEAEEKKITLESTVAHTFKVVVVAGDDQEGTEGWSFTETLTVPACKEQPPTEEPPTEEPPTEEPTTPAETTTPAPTTTTTAAVGVNANLAETGASIGLPIGIGALLLLGGGALLLVLRKRDKANKA